MKTRKENLIENLQIAVRSLENGSIYYNWHQQESCNCGVVAQSMLGVSPSNLKNKFLTKTESGDSCNIFNKALMANTLNITGKEDREKVDASWRTAVKAYCPMTGAPLVDVFNELYEAGLSREDICHLEYMTNPLILKKSGIDATNKKIYRKGFINSILKKYDVEYYYKSPKNLAKYLTAWVEILKETPDDTKIKTNDIDELRSMEINYVASQEFEKAAKIRDQIASIK